ncbi:DivIVA domain-containing protein [Umezakia ovalisporum]|jgi:cell division septum initiation protein DivIVA|uniref:DivIVA domain-containing protein n=2 Tax=Umezakia ovalisporum TaxID=75695 RepID=A0AA43KFW5_9CYAN|nr:DivIVA domain-containing protein [Umezakia ovalisporum]MDH6058553.1 DivIVA domain-containing protein [Umezakia ovalisporum FSS-43]MDH6064961.1 DivIVA domain-containing protein [Umezakia ovalisporum FSS-62]MDH6067593.1 DivIVA domain-containing protein [Umezakia ovalisporum APH033B]MDH6069476.1 DivIVA domain-containing protein [Umezakia ovalisporum CobakiLakeA]MDH6075396.1 DivIVA domain-containing protein [Umezakia ovalisporum CS-1034]
MLQPHLSNGQPNDNGSYTSFGEHPNRTGNVDILEELNRLEDLILYGFRIPLTGRTLVNEDKLIEQIDFIRISLPEVFHEAAAILQQKDEILLEAEEYGQRIVEVAQGKRAQILAESDIFKEAEKEAEELRIKVQQECDAIMQATLAEIEHKRLICQQELDELRQTAIAQAQDIENGADEYADTVLEGIEQDLKDMLRIITNGRQQLRQESSQRGDSKFIHNK